MQSGSDAVTARSFLSFRSPRMWLALLLAAFVIIVGLSIAVSPIAALAGSALIFLVVLSYIRPVAAVYLCLAIAPVEMLHFEYDPMYRTLADHYDVPTFVTVLVFFIVMARKIVRPGHSTGRDRSFYLLPLAWVCWSAISGLWTVDFEHYLSVIWAMVCGMMLLVMMNEVIDSQKDLEHLVDFLAMVGIVLATVTAISAWTHLMMTRTLIGHDVSFMTVLWMHGERRPSGFAHSAESSSALVFFIFMIIASFVRAGRFKKVFLFVSALFALAMMLLIGAKGAVIGLFAGVGMLLFLVPYLRKHFVRHGILALLLLIIVYGIIGMFLEVGDNLTANSDVAEFSFSFRIRYWKIAYDYFLHRWIGTGAGGLAPVVDPAVNIHSFYLCVIFELGLIGVLIVGSMIISWVIRFFRAYFRCENENLRLILCCVAASIASVLIHGLADVFQEQLYFWMVVGMACIACRLCRPSANTDKSLPSTPPSPS